MNPNEQVYIIWSPGESVCVGCGAVVVNFKTFEHNEFHRRVEPKENSDA